MGGPEIKEDDKLRFTVSDYGSNKDLIKKKIPANERNVEILKSMEKYHIISSER